VLVSCVAPMLRVRPVISDSSSRVRNRFAPSGSKHRWESARSVSADMIDRGDEGVSHVVMLRDLGMSTCPTRGGGDPGPRVSATIDELKLWIGEGWTSDS
jgi:hypothetical protein